MAGAPGTGTERGLSMVEDRKGSLLEKLNKYLSCTEKVGPLTIYRMKMKDQQMLELNKKNKVIMMVGETGSGKTTLINSMINYIFGVEWKDDHRIKLIEESSGRSQAHSQTSSVTMYQIHHEDDFRIPYSISIIDTPGFGDTRGKDHDEKIMQDIRECFTKYKFSQIDAICFVVQSSAARLTPTQVYVYFKVLSIFGKDIKDNIVFFTTFADFQEPKVLSAITEADVPCAKSEDGKPVYFMVNNCMLYADNRPGEVSKRAYKAQEMQWEVAMESIGEFFLQYLPGLASKDFTLTKEVLAKRNDLEVTLDGLVQKFEAATRKQHELEQNKKALNENEEEAKKNENFEYNVTETVTRKVDSSKHSVNCQNCNSTCHQNCTADADFLVYFCGVFNWKGICGKCGHGTKRHFLEKVYWGRFVETRKETYFHIKEKYEKANKEVTTLKDVLKEIEKDMKKKEDELLKLTEEIAEILKRLQEIALKPDPVSTVDYMKRLIDKEELEGKEGFRERIKIMKGNIERFEIQSSKMAKQKNKEPL